MWPLVGRNEELAFVTRALDTGGVIITGAAGVGKSRLAHEAAEQSGRPILWLVATTAAATMPFSAFSALLSLDAVGSTTNRLELAMHLADRMAHQSEGHIVCVDDAHLLDDASAALLHQLLVAGRITATITLRTGEPVPDPVTSLWKEGVVERIELHPLSEEEAGELVARGLDGSVEKRTQSHLWSVSGGNPLFLRELVAHGVEQKTLTFADGLWRAQRPVGAGPRVAELLGDRLDAVPERVRETLELLALAEPIGLRLLELCGDPAAVVDAERRGLLAIRQEGKRITAAMAHPLYAEVLREQMPVLRARALRRGLADALEETGMRRREDVLRVALWRLEGGGVMAPDLLLAAAERASELYDHDLMARLAGAAWEQTRSFSVGMLLAQAYTRAARNEERLALLRDLEAVATDGEQRSDLALERATLLSFGYAQHDAGIAVLANAESRLVETSHRLRVRGLRALLLTFNGEARTGLTLADEVLATAGGDDEARIRALRAKAQAAALVGSYDDAVSAADEGLTLATSGRWGYPQSLGWFFTSRVQALWLSGSFRRGEDDARIAVAISARWPSITVRASAQFALGRVLTAQGHIAEALEHLRECVALLRQEDAGNLLPQAIAMLTQTLAYADRAQEAHDMFASVPEDPKGAQILQEFALKLGQPWLLAAQGETTRAASLLVAAAAEARRLGLLGIEPMYRHDALRLGRLDQQEQLAALRTQVDGPIVALYSDHANALAHGDGDALDAVAAGFAGLPALLLAAEAATEASIAHGRAGFRAKASAASARAAGWLAETGDAHTPVISLGPTEDPLTAREREIARLAADGLSNKEIAERLVLSVRTVESHVYRACAKLGVTDRRALAGTINPTTDA